MAVCPMNIIITGSLLRSYRGHRRAVVGGCLAILRKAFMALTGHVDVWVAATGSL